MADKMFESIQNTSNGGPVSARDVAGAVGEQHGLDAMSMAGGSAAYVKIGLAAKASGGDPIVMNYLASQKHSDLASIGSDKTLIDILGEDGAMKAQDIMTGKSAMSKGNISANILGPQMMNKIKAFVADKNYEGATSYLTAGAMGIAGISNEDKPGQRAWATTVMDNLFPDLAEKKEKDRTERGQKKYLDDMGIQRETTEKEINDLNDKKYRTPEETRRLIRLTAELNHPSSFIPPDEGTKVNQEKLAAGAAKIDKESHEAVDKNGQQAGMHTALETGNATAGPNTLRGTTIGLKRALDLFVDQVEKGSGGRGGSAQTVLQGSSGGESD
jgi:hypothetical protein